MRINVLFATCLLSLTHVINLNAQQLNTSGTKTLTQDEVYMNNVNSTRPLGSGVFADGAVGVINSAGYNITSKDNTIGVDSIRNAQLTINGTGNNWLYIQDNLSTGIGASNGDITIRDMNLNISSNKNTGISVFGKSLNIFGDSVESNNLIINQNRNVDAMGLWTSGNGIFSTGVGANVNIKNMNIVANENGVYGFNAYGGGIINIEGLADGTNKITANKNSRQDGTNGIGIHSSQVESEITIKNMDIEVNENGKYGIGVWDTGTLNIEGTENSINTLVTKHNKTVAGSDGAGIFVKNSGIGNGVFIERMNVDASENGLHGITAQDGGVLEIVGTGTSLLKTNDNRASDSSESVGIYATDSNSKITIEDMNVESINNGSHGIKSQNNAIISFSSSDGNNWLKVNNNGHTTNNFGIYAVGGQIDITDMDVEVKDNHLNAFHISNSGTLKMSSTHNNKLFIENSGGHGISVGNLAYSSIEGYDIYITGGNRAISLPGGSLSIIGSDSKNKLVIKDNTAPDGISIATSGVGVNFELFNMETYVYNNDFLNVRNGSVFDAKNSTLHIPTDKKVFITDNAATIKLDNTHIYDSKILLESQNSLGSPSTISLAAKDSSLSGSIQKTSGISSDITLMNTVWRNIGRSEISKYVANSADIYMNVYFAANSGTKGDLLTIQDSSSGNTTLHVNSIGFEGAKEVKVIDQSSVSGGDANGSVSLAGGVVDSGAYEYKLYKGDLSGASSNANNYYLRSNGAMTSTAKTIANAPAVRVHIVKAGMNELRKRMGELRDNNPEDKSGVWARSHAKYLKVSENIDSYMNIFGFEGGYDKQIYSDCDDKVYAGLMAGYLYTDDIRNKNDGVSKGSGHANTPTIGAYATWLNREGWFADVTLRHFWFDMDFSSHTSQNQTINFNIDRSVTAGSIEGGRQLSWLLDHYTKYIIEPKVELVYAYSKGKTFKTKGAVNDSIHYGQMDSIQTRASVLFGYNKMLENGSIIEPFIEIGVVEEWGGKTDIKYAGSSYQSNISGTSIELTTGINAKLNRNWNLYSDITFEKGSIVEALGANVGIRFNW